LGISVTYISLLFVTYVLDRAYPGEPALRDCSLLRTIRFAAEFAPLHSAQTHASFPWIFLLSLTGFNGDLKTKTTTL
jgi:hypothetical protein